MVWLQLKAASERECFLFVIHGWNMQEMGFRHSCIQGLRDSYFSPPVFPCVHLLPSSDFLPEISPCSYAALLTFPSLPRKKGSCQQHPNISPAQTILVAGLRMQQCES